MEVPSLAVEPQGEIDDWTHPDLLDRRLRMAIEADSWTYHSLQEAFEYDVRRYTGLVRDGWVVVRFCWDDVMDKRDYVRKTLDVIASRQERLLELDLLVA